MVSRPKQVGQLGHVWLTKGTDRSAFCLLMPDSIQYYSNGNPIQLIYSVFSKKNAFYRTVATYWTVIFLTRDLVDTHSWESSCQIWWLSLYCSPCQIEYCLFCESILDLLLFRTFHQPFYRSFRDENSDFSCKYCLIANTISAGQFLRYFLLGSFSPPRLSNLVEAGYFIGLAARHEI